MANIKSIINIHDIEVITERKHKSAHFPINAKLPTQYTTQKKHQSFETIMETYTKESVKAHLKVH